MLTIAGAWLPQNMSLKVGSNWKLFSRMKRARSDRRRSVA
jgi:hypothetical protein